MSIYEPRDIEAKWQKKWEDDGVYHAKDGSPSDRAKKFYGLIEFPYPSGEGLHVGHPRSYTAIDIMTRKKRMEGFNVLYPIGWDAFGLPTENFAIKHKVKPEEATAKNVANFKRQLKYLGFGFDWSREVNTTDPKYYKWTQWMFLKFFNSYFDEIEGRARPIEELAIPDSIRAQGEAVVRTFVDAHRMAYKAESTINWCPKDKIGLANEEAQGGVCERCGTAVEQRIKAQWMIRITKYADRLIDDLETVDYLEKIKAQQINWIGRSEGAEVEFSVVTPDAVRSSVGAGEDVHHTPLREKIVVFTTRPDTLFGATYLVLAPEHPMVEGLMKQGLIQNQEEIRAYQESTRRKSNIERQENKEKTGVVLKGVAALNPATNEQIPIWIADYVLSGYGTGAIMAVPTSDDRDAEFAKQHGLRRCCVVVPEVLWAGQNHPQRKSSDELEEYLARILAGDVVCSEGKVINSGFLDGLSTAEAKEKIIEWLEMNGIGKRTMTYRLRDWVFSRQRYWGEPIPIVICEQCGYVPVPEKELPLVLPEVEQYEPTDSGESPLAAIRSWVEVSCPSCGGKAERETDTMPNWAGSSWYFLRYCDAHNDAAFADPEKLKFWLPINLYNGGMEHTTLHLLYSRFWYKFLWDLNLIPRECGSEPYAKRRSHAMILGEGGVKMSKSKGNVVNPDDVVDAYGADVFRTYEMFIGPFDADAPWDTNGIQGVKRFLEKVWRLFDVGAGSPRPDRSADMSDAVEVLFHRTIKKVSEDIENMRFNTAVSALMILVNEIGDTPLSREYAEALLLLLAPFAPHLTEELWQQKLGHTDSIHHAAWPTYDPSKLQETTFEMVIQVNGKVRDRVTVAADISEEEAVRLALASEQVQKYMEGKTPTKTTYVKGRLVSIAV